MAQQRAADTLALVLLLDSYRQFVGVPLDIAAVPCGANASSRCVRNSNNPIISFTPPPTKVGFHSFPCFSFFKYCYLFVAIGSTTPTKRRQVTHFLQKWNVNGLSFA